MKAIGVAIAFLLLGAAIGAGATWYWEEQKVAEQFAAGVAYQLEIAPVTEAAASITMSMHNSSFVHTATVCAAGAVATETAVTDFLVVENTHETRTAKATKLTLKNPYTGTEGLHDDLQTDYTEISITVQGKTEPLYHNGEFKDVVIGDLSAGAYVNLTVTFTLEVAVAGTFQDAQTYTNYIYLVQPSAEDTDQDSFTVTT